MATKKRGIDMKLYSHATFSALLVTTPAVTGYTELTHVNKVSKSFKNEEFSFETREQADDETITSGRTSEFTVSFYCDLADTAGYMAFVAAANAQTTLGLLFAATALTTDAAANVVEVGNFIITEEDSDEPKKEGVLVNFKCKPNTFYVRIVDAS